MSNLPDTLDAKALARLLYKSEKTILRDVSRRPETLPPFTRQGKKPIWITQVFFQWLVEGANAPIKIEICFSTTLASQLNHPPVMLSIAESLMSAVEDRSVGKRVATVSSVKQK
ncbi:MAG: hypothetical protein ACYCTY_07635 [Sulfuricella sp.]